MPSSRLNADAQYDDQQGGNVATGIKGNNDYVSRSGQYEIPVQKDEKPVEDPIDARTADSDETLGMFFCLNSSLDHTLSVLRSSKTMH